MTDPKGNSDPDNVNGNIEVKGKLSSVFPAGPVINCFVIEEDSRTRNVNCFCFGNVEHKASNHRCPARGMHRAGNRRRSTSF